MPQRAFVMRVVNDVRPHVNETSGRRFKNSLLWRAFLRGCVFGDRLNRIRVHVRPHRRQKKNVRFQTKMDACGRGLGYLTLYIRY